MTRTYGKYAYVPPPNLGRNGGWALAVEPGVAVRLKRVLGRVRTDRAGRILVSNTIEVCRDLEWAMERWPLAPVDPSDETRLTNAATAHRDREARVQAINDPEHQQRALPREPIKAPREYQRTALELLRTTGRLLITDEPGLGKTYMGLMNALYDDGLPMIVVPPTHLPSRWIEEIKDSMPWLTFATAKKTTPPKDWTPEDLPDVFIVPYSKLDGWSHHLAGAARTVVFDEVQDLRSGTSTNKGTAAAMICQDAGYVLGLTATPVYNYGGELWNILDIMAPDTLGTKDEFTREWGRPMNNGRIFINQPAALGSYLREQGVMIGRTRKEVGRELPDVIKVPHTVASDRKALDAVKGDAVALARLILSETTSREDRFRSAGELDWKLREATGIAKAPYVAEFVRMILEAEEKVVLFGWHRAVYDVWMEALRPFHPVLYSGSESPTQKAAAQHAFIHDPKCRILIMSLRSGSGVDGLQTASRTAVFGELDWSPQVHTQAIGRVRRDGMGEEPPIAYYLTADEGSDPSIMETLQIKRQQSEPMITPDGKLMPGAAPDRSRARTLATAILGGHQ